MFARMRLDVTLYVNCLSLLSVGRQWSEGKHIFFIFMYFTFLLFLCSSNIDALAKRPQRYANLVLPKADISHMYICPYLGCH
jgi:hypothetical protein